MHQARRTGWADEGATHRRQADRLALRIEVEQLHAARRRARLARLASGLTAWLGVLPTDVVNAADRWPVPERAVEPAPIVGPQPR
jgi:hypothetical protein